MMQQAETNIEETSDQIDSKIHLRNKTSVFAEVTSKCKSTFGDRSTSTRHMRQFPAMERRS